MYIDVSITKYDLFAALHISRNQLIFGFHLTFNRSIVGRIFLYAVSFKIGN